MYDEKAAAYAVVENEKIDVRTVSETRRAAIVNWLVVSRRIPIFLGTTDEEIEEIWDKFSGDAIVVGVEVSRTLPLF